MLTKWQHKKLSEVAQNISRPFKFSNREKVIFINTGDVLEGKFLHHNYSNKALLPGQAKKRIVIDDILFSEIRPGNKRFAFVDFNADDHVVSTKFMVIRSEDSVLPKYLYLVLTSKTTLEYFQVIAESRSGTFPQITFDSVGHHSIPIPPKEEQQKIVATIESLDIKLELNRRMNETLEAMAKSIFKSWFVDFDPVRAKAEGRQPIGMDSETAALFPDSFEDSPLGKIPKGWRVGTIAELAIVSSGNRPDIRTSTPNDQIATPLFGGGGLMGYVENPLYTVPIILTGRVGTLGMVFRITFPCWPSDNTLVILPKDAESYEYLYFCTNSIGFESLNRGSTQPLVTQSDLQKQEMVVPSLYILQRFHNVVAPLLRKIDLNNEDSHTLSAIRDALLPKLLAGEIRVKDAVKFAESAI